MLQSKIRKTWSAVNDRWMYQRHIAYLNEDGNMETDLFTGWSVEEVEEKTRKLGEALKRP